MSYEAGKTVAEADPEISEAIDFLNLTAFENRYTHKDGTPRWISWHTAAEGDVAGPQRGEQRLDGGARHDGQVYTREFKVESGLNRDVEVIAKAG